MRAVVEFKWQKYARPRWMWLVGEFIVFLVGYLGGIYALTVSNAGGHAASGVALLAAACLVNLHFAYREAVQMLNEGRAYFTSAQNWFDLIAILNVFVLPLLLAFSPDAKMAIAVLASMGTVCSHGSMRAHSRLPRCAPPPSFAPPPSIAGFLAPL